MWQTINQVLEQIDDLVWGVPLMVLILAGGILLTARLGLLQIRRLPLALQWMVKNEENGEGEVTSFGALCTALSATIGTGNIVGVATAIAAGGPGALCWAGRFIILNVEWAQTGSGWPGSLHFLASVWVCLESGHFPRSMESPQQ